MRKEVIIAIFLGFALGLVITFGIWQANKALKKQKPEKEVTPITVEETKPSPSPSFSLEIFSPEDQAIYNENKTLVTGKTQPGSLVAIVFEEGEKIVGTDKAGNFEAEIPLILGINEIQITAFSPEAKEETQNLGVFYTTTEI